MLMGFLWAKQPWLSWPFLIQEMIQFLKHLHGPSLISVLVLCVLVSFMLGEPSFAPRTPVYVTSAEWRKRNCTSPCWALVPLDGSMTLWPVSHSSQWLSSPNLLMLNSAPSLMKMLNGTEPSIDPWGIACYWPPASLSASDGYFPGLAVQVIFRPPHSSSSPFIDWLLVMILRKLVWKALMKLRYTVSTHLLSSYQSTCLIA